MPLRNKETLFVLPMERKHLGDVAEIERLCFSEPWTEKSLELLCGNGGVGFVVEADHRAVAYGGMVTVLDEGQITNIAVHPDYRRLGYGSVVVDALIKYADKNGITSISLEVRESNTAAIALYESFEWKRCGIRKNFYKFPVEAAIVMVRSEI